MNTNNLIKNLWTHLRKRRKLQFLLVIILMFIASFAEVMSVGAVIPFLGVITNPESIYLNPSIQPYLSTFNIDSPDELMLPITVIFVCSSVCRGRKINAAICNNTTFLWRWT